MEDGSKEEFSRYIKDVQARWSELDETSKDEIGKEYPSMRSFIEREYLLNFIFFTFCFRSR
jgi:hypothetical protein